MAVEKTKQQPFDENAVRKTLKNSCVNWSVYVSEIDGSRHAMLAVGECDCGYSIADCVELDRDELMALRSVIDHLIDEIDA